MIFILAVGYLALKCNPKLNPQPLSLPLLRGKNKRRTLLIRRGEEIGGEWS